MKMINVCPCNTRAARWEIPKLSVSPKLVSKAGSFIHESFSLRSSSLLLSKFSETGGAHFSRWGRHENGGAKKPAALRKRGIPNADWVFKRTFRTAVWTDGSSRMMNQPPFDIMQLLMVQCHFGRFWQHCWSVLLFVLPYRAAASESSRFQVANVASGFQKLFKACH